MKHNSPYLRIREDSVGCTISGDSLERWDRYANAEEHKCHGSVAPVKRVEGNREIGEGALCKPAVFWAESDSRENGMKRKRCNGQMEWADGMESGWIWAMNVPAALNVYAYAQKVLRMETERETGRDDRDCT